MRRPVAILVLILLLAGMIPCAGAEVERNVLLDNAFKMLDEGNIFIERYNQLTGAEVEPILPSGVPYFFGGKDYDRIIKNLPRFGKGVCKETTTFYRKGKTYPYGLDCQGYIYAIRSESGMVGISPLNAFYQPIYTDKKTGKKCRRLIPFVFINQILKEWNNRTTASCNITISYYGEACFLGTCVSIGCNKKLI